MKYNLTTCLLAAMFFSGISSASAAIEPAHLRCEYIVNPQGIDIVKPRFFWTLQSADRGQRQTSYQVVVASSLKLLADDAKADLWDSGVVQSDESIHIIYQGRALQSGEHAYWHVRVWDQDKKQSQWSEIATWSAGLLSPTDWTGSWITSPAISKGNARTNGGFLAALSSDQNQPKWIMLDLGKGQTIDAVHLYPLYHGKHFPLRYKIEVSNKSDLSDAKTVVDETAGDVTPPALSGRLSNSFEPTEARYVRLTATKLGDTGQPNYPLFSIGLSELAVMSGTKNVALGAVVETPDSMDNTVTHRKFLVDGLRFSTTPFDNKMAQPVPMLRKKFIVTGKVKRATAYVTARGLYEMRLNGEKVGDHILSPGWTEYNIRIPYQTFDVTSQIVQGENAVGALLGVGWYAGPVGAIAPRGRERYGPYAQLMARIDIDTEDGKTQTIVSDDSWRTSIKGPIQCSEIYDGEIQDLSLAQPGWDKPGFDDSAWIAADAVPADPAIKLVAQRNDPIRIKATLKPIALKTPMKNVYVFDMGQNMVGWCRLRIRGAAGADVVVRPAERLDPAGTGAIDVAHLHSARATDIFAVATNDEQVVEPHFTYHGFRYVQVEGLTQPPRIDDLEGMVFHTDAPMISTFESSNDIANHLIHNILWTLRGNLMSIPTDCPQRSERLGWMGDIQAFSQTSTYTMDMGAFYTKWLLDIRDAQFDDGAYTALTPHFHTGFHNKPAGTKPGAVYGVFAAAPGWSDAGTVIPYWMYIDYADKQLLAEHFESARRWVDYIYNNNKDTLLFVNGRGEQYNDWLAGQGIPTDIFSTAFFAHSTDLVARMAIALDRHEDADHYKKLFHDIRASFNKNFVKPDGTVGTGSQSCYVFALSFDLLDADLRRKAIEKLREGIKSFRGHLSTGIQASHRLILELSKAGYHDEACALVNLRTEPSWGYMVDQGATTIWEHWHDHIWASSNHFAHASVGQWLWENIAGISPDEAVPGYKHIVIAPKPGPGFTSCRATLDTIRGPVNTNWKVDNNIFSLRLTIPANTTATVSVPTSDASTITESGQPIKTARFANGVADFTVGSGTYSFASPYACTSGN